MPVIFLVLCSIIACGRLTGTSTVTTTELARKSEKNETKSFSLQHDNYCIPPKWRNKQSIWTQLYDGVYWKFWIDTRGNEMTVNLGDFIGDDDTGVYDSKYIGFLNCAGSFTYDCPSYLNDCSVYVPIISGEICNHETGERYSGKIDFQYRTVCPVFTYLLDGFKKHGDCFYEIKLCL